MPYKGHLAGNASVSKRGWGRPGYCQICDLLNTRPELKKPFDRLLFEKASSTKVNEWLAANADMPVNRRTFYSHRDHSKDPKDRIVSQVRRQQAAGTVPQQASDEEFLDAIVAAGFARIQQEPESVTTDQALKAVGIRQQAKASKQGGIAILIATLTKPLEGELSLALPAGLIEGEAVEVDDQT